MKVISYPTYLFVPLGHLFEVTDEDLIQSSPEGLDRVKSAIAYGISLGKEPDIYFGAFPGIVPSTLSNIPIDLGQVMARDMVRRGVEERQIIRGHTDTWGTLNEVAAACRSARRLGAALVFVTSDYHVARVKLCAIEALGAKTYRRWRRTQRLLVLGIDTRHASPRDVAREPLKRTAQRLRLLARSLRRIIPRTLKGRL